MKKPFVIAVREIFATLRDFRGKALVLVSCLCFTAFIARAATPASDTFYGASIGETADQVRTALGKPTMTGISEHGLFWSYRIDDNKAWRVVIMQKERVVGIYVRQEFLRVSHLSDGAGLSFGDSITKMFGERGAAGPLVYSTYAYPTSSGVYHLYEITSGVITAIGITRFYDYSLPWLATWDQRDGQTPFRAFLLGRDDHPINAFEMQILSKQPCNYDGLWRFASSTRVFLYGHHYDRVLVTCSVPVYQRNFFFDVTAALKPSNSTPSLTAR